MTDQNDTDNIEPPEDEQDDNGPVWLTLLQSDTPREEVKQRPAPGGSGKTLDYVTARFVMDRLDAAVGPMNWQAEFETLPGGATQAVRCRIGIREPGGVDDGQWVWKSDVGTPSSIEPEKGAHSDAFKRAAVHWGVARDLYDERDEQHPTGARTQQAPVMQMPNQGAQGGSVRAQVMGGAVGPAQQEAMQQGAFVQQPPGIVQYDENGPQQVGGAPAWVCPVHDDAKIVPAGISKRTGRPYKAFYACPVAGCDQKGSSVG